VLISQNCDNSLSLSYTKKNVAFKEYGSEGITPLNHNLRASKGGRSGFMFRPFHPGKIFAGIQCIIVIYIVCIFTHFVKTIIPLNSMRLPKTSRQVSGAVQHVSCLP